VKLVLIVLLMGTKPASKLSIAVGIAVIFALRGIAFF
jgi:hypothetical protein